MNSEFIFRRLTTDELQTAIDLIGKTFTAFRVADMPDESVQFFQDAIVLEKHQERIDKGEMVFTGCFDGNQLAGVIVMGNLSYVDLFFVDGEYHGQGIGRRLFEIVKEEAKQAGVKEIGVHSSPFAVEIYRALGFEPNGEMHLEHGIRSYPMVLKLSE